MTASPTSPSRPFDDGERLASLNRTGILDTPPEARFDRLARLAAHLLDAPSALVSLVDKDRQWFKARHNWEGSEGERRYAICDHTIRQPDVLTIPDTTADPRFSALPSVTGSPHIRFYAGSPIHSPDGQPVGSLCVIDFAPRKSLSGEQRWLLQMLAAIVSDEITLTASLKSEERERQRLRDAAEAVPNGFILVDAEGRVVFVNRGYRRMFAQALREGPEGIPYSRLLEQLADAGLVEAAMKDRAGWISASLAQVSKERASELRLTDGRIILVSNHPTAEGGMVGLRSDITGRVLQAEELRSARELAEAANRARGEFLAIMSHEVRTPLNGVLGMLEALGSTRLDPRQTGLVAVARKSAVALLENLNSLLDLSKLEAGLLLPDSQLFNPRQLAAEVLALFADQAMAKGVQTRLEIEPSVPDWVVGDPARLRQMLQNLLSNAVKFTSRGAVDLEVSVPSDRLACLAFAVRDTGVGIPAGRRADLFKRFSQLDASYASKFGGTGLGLSIVRELAELLGGTIEVQDDLAGGACFRLTLPLPPAPAPALPARSEDAAAPPLRLLVVDDNETNRLVNLLMLEDLGHEVTLAASGSEAIEAAALHPYELILTDISMAGMDGVTMLTSLRSGTGPNRDTPAIALTAGLSPEDVKRCRDAGFLQVLVKPIDKARLGHEVRKAVQANPLNDLVAAGLAELGQELGDEILDSLRAALARDLRKWRTTLAAGLDGDEPDTVRAALHGIKGVGATLGLSAMVAELGVLEEKGANAARAEIERVTGTLDTLLSLLECHHG
jgi:signal transduction histidine kinase/DNA-binding NarL/FixJ family response regulator